MTSTYDADYPIAKYGDGTYILFMAFPKGRFIIYLKRNRNLAMKCLKMYSFILILTMATTNNIQQVIRNILSDIRVDLSDEFDKNFERQGFFSGAWARRKSPLRPGGSILVDTGRLRRSIKSKTTGNSISFYSDENYASIHNDGGEITVTEKMKRYFWYKYQSATGSFGRKKNGELRRNKRTIQLGSEAEFWKHMALMKVGRKIQIPRRRFLGVSQEVEKTIREIIEENLTEFFGSDFKL